MKIAVGHPIFLTELIKSPISYADKFSKMSDSKKKIKSWIYLDHNSELSTHNSSQCQCDKKVNVR